MISVRVGFAALLIAVLGLAATESKAAPIDPKQVPADAKWVGHLDVDAMRSSTVVAKAWKELVQRRPDTEENLKRANEALGLDVRSDVHGLTVYGKGIGDRKGVLIVQAKIKPRHLEELAEKAQDHKVTEYGSHKLHSWTDRDRTAWGTLLGDQGIVFASGSDELKAALDVIDGKAESLGARMPEDRRLPPGTIAGGYVHDLGDAPNLPPQMALAKQIDSHLFLIGEKDGESFYMSRTVMKNDEVIGQVKDMLKGLRAFALVQAGDDAASKKVVESFSMQTEGKTVRVHARVSADTVWEALSTQAKRMAELRAKNRSK